MSIGLLGQKIGMTSVYDANGRLHPVTVIAVGDNALLRRLTNANDGYSAVQVGFGSQKESRVSKAELGVFKSANSEPKRFVREFRLTADLGDGEVNLTVTQFQPRLCRRDRPLQRQRLPRRDEEAQLRWARCGARF